MIKIGISGICGKMGLRILNLAKVSKDFEVVFGLERKDHPDIGKTIESVVVTSDTNLINNCQCLIEFTNPQATVEHLLYLVEFKKSAVIGTTGLTEQEQAKIKEAAKIVPIIFAPNMSVGVNVLFKLLNQAAKALKGYRVSVSEAHHIHKKDSPSGTAKKIAQIINEQGFNIKTDDINAERIGEVVGDHKVVFESDTDRLEISHSAKTRDIFAQGALYAAKWLVNKKPGLYSMNDVLSI